MLTIPVSFKEKQFKLLAPVFHMSIRTHSAVFVISKILKEIFTPSEFRLHDPL